MLQEQNRRKGFFEPDQYRRVLKALPDYLQPVITTAYITGWRIASEILTRQKFHLDLDAGPGWLRLEPGEGKTTTGRNFPLTPDLRDTLKAQLDRTREFEKAHDKIVPWLFHRNGEPIKDFRSAWATACTAAGLTARIPHDFRRTAVRNLERASVPRSAAMELVGHKTESMYRRYAICDESMLKDGAEKLAALHILEGQTTGQVVPIRSQVENSSAQVRPKRG
jgi:integrase